MSQEFPRVLVTGATSGIGLATARRLAGSPGYALFLTGRTPEKVASVARELEPAGTMAADLTTPHAADQLVEKAIGALGGLDAVIHCAGVGLIKPALETTDADFVRVTNINIRGTFLVARAACAAMAEQKKGRFITLPGILGRAVMKNAAAYCASKFAVTGLIKAMAGELQRANLQFTLLHLGGVDTPFYDDIGMSPQRDKMIPADLAAAQIQAALELPSHLVLNEITLQPGVHQLG